MNAGSLTRPDEAHDDQAPPSFNVEVEPKRPAADARPSSPPLPVAKNSHLTVPEAPQLELSNTNNQLAGWSPNSSPRASCRYCMEYIDPAQNVSQCKCNGLLCQPCLEGELALTEGRGDGIMRCTVCKTNYDVEIKKRKLACKEFFVFLTTQRHCGLRDSLGPMEIREYLGILCVVVGTTFWVICTALFSAEASATPDYLFIVLASLDVIIGLTTVWFCCQVQWMSVLFFTLLHIGRVAYMWNENTLMNRVHTWQQGTSWSMAATSTSTALVLLTFMTADLVHRWRVFRRRRGQLFVSGMPVTLRLERYG